MDVAGQTFYVLRRGMLLVSPEVISFIARHVNDHLECPPFRIRSISVSFVDWLLNSIVIICLEETRRRYTNNNKQGEHAV